MKKYASSSFKDHLQKKATRDLGFQHRDTTFIAAGSNKPDYSVSNRKMEKGIKINVGGPQPTKKAEEGASKKGETTKGD